MQLAALFLLAAPAATTVPPPCIAQATGLLEQEAFAEALATAERCEVVTRHPRSRFLRGVASLALGRRAKAILALQRYLASDLAAEPPRLRAIATVHLQNARREAGLVRLRISPLMEATRIDVQLADRSTLIAGLDELEVRPDGVELWLDPGRQRITVRNSHGSTVRDVEVVAGAEVIALEFSLEPGPAHRPPPPPPPPSRFPRRSWLALSGIVGAGNMFAGVVLLPVGAVRGGRQLVTDPGSCEPVLELDRCRYRLAGATTLRGAGAGLLGAGLGVLAGGLTGLTPAVRTRKIAWSAEVGVGAALGVAGVALLAVGLNRFNQANTDPSTTPTPWAWHADAVGTPTSMYGLGGAVLGMGIGLATTAAAGLITQRLTANGRGARLGIHSQGFILRF